MASSREKLIRDWAHTDLDHALAVRFARDLDALLEQARREERERIVKWLRTTPRAMGHLISIHSSQDVARLAEDLARGEEAKGE